MRALRLALVLLALLSDAQLVRADALHDLMLAAALDNGQGIRQLLSAGVDPNLRASNGDSALHVAAREESAAALAQLLKHPDLQVDASNQAGETPLMLAALRGRLDLVKALVARGAAINRVGWSPLHYACTGPGGGVVSWLLLQGAEMNAKAPNGTTALMMAAGYGGPSAAETLLDVGADPKLRNDLGLSAADFARRAGNERLEQRLRQAAER
jgi:ankyrin repeat protein